ncbi:hypothetical protein [Paenibacillus eucommiae]|uniref:Guanylate kinase n=1 Tax=Paenibacillus eucommiae TaxID=1355755 RepID=A0ABS4J605_9BACL|nr:hypothetical protein [Paenibacillus eucommiae]MBP1995286.1 hypothetical protein [Paenibacillus eucommiae]
MKNIVKAADPSQQRALFIPSASSAGKSSLIKRKTLAGCPFELGVRVIRANVAKEREWLWAEER